MKFTVSVIIPAYNVEKYIAKTIQSALIQPEVEEVIVIDDGSSDNTFKIIKEFQLKWDKIKVLNHKNNKNKGRSATRNLGLKNASQNYIGFLDADDYYMPDRFRNDKVVFEENEHVEVVYNAVGYHFYRELKEKEKGYFKKLNTVSQPLEHVDAFEALISSKYGYLHLNGLTVKKSVIDKIGFFNETLPVAEDSDFIFKLGFKCKFKAGLLDSPVALRGIHEENIYNDENLYKKWNVKLYESLLSWCYQHNATKGGIYDVLNWLWIIKLREKSSLLKYILYWIGFNFRHPQTILSVFFIKYFPVVRLRQKLIPFIFRNSKNI